jgi:hypothetical protein
MTGSHLTIIKRFSTIFAIGGFFIIVFLFAQPAQAANSTLRGLGYWGTNGYVSFNCLDDVTGDRLDDIGNLYNLPEPRGFHFFAPPCEYNQHAVTIDVNNNFSGQAWNYTKGYISFSGSATPPDSYAATSGTNCSNVCNASNNCWACYNESQQKVYGWARVDTTGEWIRLDSAAAIPVRLKTCNNSGTFPPLDIQPGAFIGYASSPIGDLSFNCQSDTDPTACGTKNGYNVYISNLSIGSLSAPNWTYTEACDNNNALVANLMWCVKSGQQNAYEIVINDSDYGATPNTSNAFCWTGKIPSNTTNFFPHLSCPRPMVYGHSYYWWIRLYDENGTPTEWYQYYGNSTADTDGNIDNNVKTFTTYKHEFPTPFFIWSPDKILVGTTTTFTASSTYYTDAQPTQPQACNIFACHYLWTVTGDNYAVISSSTEAITDIIFNKATDTTISLKVTDTANYFCTKALISSINYDLPIWREIKAQ